MFVHLCSSVAFGKASKELLSGAGRSSSSCEDRCWFFSLNVKERKSALESFFGGWGCLLFGDSCEGEVSAMHVPQFTWALLAFPESAAACCRASSPVGEGCGDRVAIGFAGAWCFPPCKNKSHSVSGSGLE